MRNIKVLALALVLAAICGAQSTGTAIPWGSWTTSGSIKVMPMYVPASVMQQLGLPGSTTAPDSVGIFVETNDPSTDAFLVTATITISGNAINMTAAVPRDRNQPCAIAVFNIDPGSNVTGLSVKVKELHTTAESETINLSN